MLHFANELGPVRAHVRNESVDVIDGKHDATDAQRVHRRVYGPNLIALGVWNLSSSMPCPSGVVTLDNQGALSRSTTFAFTAFQPSGDTPSSLHGEPVRAPVSAYATKSCVQPPPSGSRLPRT